MARPPQQGYGDGSVYREKETGRWRGEIRRANGQRRRVSGCTETEASTNLADIRRQLDDGRTLERDMSLGKWIDWWLGRVNATKSARNADHNRWALNQLDHIQRIPLRKLTVEDVEAELDRLSTRRRPKDPKRTSPRGPLGRSSLVKVRRTLAEVLSAAERRGKVTQNVAKMAVIPPGAAPPVPRRSLTPEEAKALLATAKETEGGKWHPLITVMLYCGLRPGEVTGLPLDAVDLVEGSLTVRQSRKVAPDGKMSIGATKAHSDRVLAMPEAVEKAFRAALRAQRATKRSAPAWEENGLVFANEIGRPIDPSNLRRVVRRLCKAADVKPISPNELRHTAGTLLVEAGMRLEDVADLLGHKDVTMLAEVYRHKSKRVVDLTQGQERMLSG